MNDKFAVFILTHGRPTRVSTYRTLMRQGYTGDVYIVIDNEDKHGDDYRKFYGDKVIEFDKLAIAQTFDEGDNFDDRRAVIYARNACFPIARDLGLDYFLQLDDDYSSFYHKFTSTFDYDDILISDLDAVFAAMIDFYKSVPNLLTVTFAQGGDFIGGRWGNMAHAVRIKRKAMNTFFCSTHRPFQWYGRINEDVNTYTTTGNRGGLFFMINNIMITQETTQHNAGGMTELYLNAGTYVKSFYTVMYSPSAVKIGQIGPAHQRIHHFINWHHAVPCIVREDLRKRPSSFRPSYLIDGLLP